jgi:hypothetical protein
LENFGGTFLNLCPCDGLRRPAAKNSVRCSQIGLISILGLCGGAKADFTSFQPISAQKGDRSSILVSFGRKLVDPTT